MQRPAHTGRALFFLDNSESGLRMDGWWVSRLLAEQNGQVILVSWIFWVIFSICLHELAHGVAAIRLGDRTPIETGHMTWSPLTHMGTNSLIAFAILGIAWGLMPVDPTRIRGRYGDAIVAAAGPACNLALCVIAAILHVVWVDYVPTTSGPFHANMERFLSTGVMLNLLLMAFNLIPAPPLDGSRIVGSFFPAFNRLFMTDKGGLVALGIFAVVFLFGGRFLFPLAEDGANALIGAVAAVLP